jgi:predicted Zn-dependent peptidase
VFSFFTHVDAGSVQGPYGQTGLAHMFEHMAFKGTDKIGTTDYPPRRKLSPRLRSRSQLIAQRDKRIGRDDTSSRNLKNPERRHRGRSEIRQAQRIWRDRRA